MRPHVPDVAQTSIYSRKYLNSEVYLGSEQILGHIFNSTEQQVIKIQKNQFGLCKVDD